MDCNKDEATRAKEIAEQKFSMHDIAGAKKFALKAQALFPALDGIPQMLSVLDVYMSAENKTYGDADWYGILGVNPRADDETVRRQYRKLALVLHPDKNKSVGADGAFKLISQAWNLISDKTKRAAYDQKVQAMSRPRAPIPRSAPPSTTTYPGANGYSTAQCGRATKKPPKSNAAPVRAPGTLDRQNMAISTFWTICHPCKMRYEYNRIYVNQRLLCPNCMQPFLAVKEDLPPSKGRWVKLKQNFSR